MSNVVLAEVVSKEVSRPFPANSEKLYRYLETDSNYNNWIVRRIEKYGFVEHEDYTVEIAKTKGRPKKIYWVTLDVAKELAMVENNPKGREARKYFIEIEKRYRKISPNVIYGYRGQIKRLMNMIEDLRIQNEMSDYDIDNAKMAIFHLKQTQDECRQVFEHNKMLARELVRIKDNLHIIAQNGFVMQDVLRELDTMTSRFQTLPNIDQDGKTLNTDTKSKLTYWGK